MKVAVSSDAEATLDFVLLLLRQWWHVNSFFFQNNGQFQSFGFFFRNYALRTVPIVPAAANKFFTEQ
jgi:hypothetical protein